MFTAMVVSFLWVIIGDLVSIHLKVYFGDTHSECQHHPFAKTNKNDTKYFKVKDHKSKDDSSLNHLVFIASNSLNINTLKAFDVYNYQIIDLSIRLNITSISQRGPPTKA